MLIGTAGMPGAGKDTVKKIVQKLGFPVIVMGDEVRAEAKRKGLDITPENLGKVMLQMRKENGPAAVAKRCIPKIEAIESSVVFIDGIRSLYEVEEFKKKFPNVRILAIHASPKTRFKRLLKRGRSDDPKDWEGFIKRDRRELKVGLGDVIATADYMVINEGTKKDLEKNLTTLLRKEVKEIWISKK
ncbi:flagellar hook-basal body complex protein FliE [Candidatus Bathyarchaeota archaeon]|nr:MAG: flagellar hook-basal body complex protein FliE [Candidatus Bathyarchaeota archaeon]